MSSLEIADLTGKQHKNVLADIRNMLDELKINSAEFSAQYKDVSGKSNLMYNLPKRETLILTSGYSAKQRAAIIDRWLELEEKDMGATEQERRQVSHSQNIAYLDFLHEKMCQIPGVNPAIAMAATLSAVADVSGLPTEHHRLALPAKAEPLAAVNPTQLGKPLGLSGQAVNKRLQSLGLQFKNERGEWELTEAGMKYGEMHPYARNGHAGYQPLWRAEAEELLK